MRPFSESRGDLRDPEEIAQWRLRDPIARYRRRLLDSGELTEAAAGLIDIAARDEMDEARVFAQQSPFPDPADAFEDLYA
jgi:pyruvate dehydrogenase E1 component alpha subunit